MPTIIKSNSVLRAASGRAHRSSATGRSSGSVGCEKSVQLLSLEGRVHAIEITCSCGEATVVELEYTESPASPGTPQSPADPEPEA